MQIKTDFCTTNAYYPNNLYLTNVEAINRGV